MLACVEFKPCVLQLTPCYFVLRAPLRLKYEYLPLKMHGFLQEAFIHPRSCVRHVLLQMHTLYFSLLDVDKKPAYSIVRLGGARTILIKLIIFV